MGGSCNAGIAGPSTSLLLVPEPRIGETLSPGQAGWVVPWRRVLGRPGFCGVSGSPSNPLQHRYENRSPVVECKHYLQDQGVSIGCRFNQSEIIQFQPFHVLVNASLGGKTLEIPSKRMELQDLGMEWWGAPPLLCGAAAGQKQGCGSPGLPHHVLAGSRATGARGRHSPGRRHLCLAVKPEAPVNLTIYNVSSNQLQLTWTSPYPKAQCLEHAVKYKSNKDTSWTVRVPRMWHLRVLCLGTSRAAPSTAALALTPWPTSLCRSSV